MILLESIRVALAALWANKMRALLTMLGVIIGVTSVIVMIAIVQGIRQQILDQFAGNGANLIFVSYQPKLGSVSRGGFGGLTMDDARATVEARGTSDQHGQPGCPNLCGRVQVGDQIAARSR